MPRGKKKKVVVVFSPDGHIVKHMYHNNHRNVEKGKVVKKVYDRRLRRHVKGEEMKIKDERHSS